MTVRIFLLPTQYDIIDFRMGNRPENILVRDFASQAEALAYEEGIEASGDAYDRIENLDVQGAKLTYSRRPEDPEADANVKAERVEVELGTAAEAQAYRKGIEDAEGLMAPLLVDDTDERFEQLLAWCSG